MIHVQYHGWVDIHYWEYLVALVYVVILYAVFARQKNIRLKKAPEYKYFLWGLWAKIAGGVIFSLVYFYYYKGGDTISYFYSALSMGKLAMKDPVGYLTVLFGDNTIENRRFFDMETGWPFAYVYFESRTFFIIKLISPIVILSLGSYLITTVVLASISYIGIWKAYRTFVSYYPELQKQLAISFLFIPSCLFWGSAILKDTFTLSAVCMWVHVTDEIFFKKRSSLGNYFLMIFCPVMILSIKPYIFMALFPVLMVWVLYFRVTRIRNSLIKYTILPFTIVIMLFTSLWVMERMENKLGKFSLDNAIKTVEVSQLDMKREEQYGKNYFDIGAFDGTWYGLLSKFPAAVVAGLFRPFIWESGSVMMMVSGLENLWLLQLAVFVFLRSGPFLPLRVISSIPMVLMSFLFAVIFAFLVGITTPNFGALVRFKIPLMPFFVSTLFIVGHFNRYVRKNKGKRIDLRDFGLGTTGVEQVKRERAGRARK